MSRARTAILGALALIAAGTGGAAAAVPADVGTNAVASIPCTVEPGDGDGSRACSR
ncbi:hypothetical protein [Streptomyces sp. NPDC059371]|uniref:hypothetical protein n=1 Tax=Streptomyces sp. NPDC059371 TaxID=3346812 RepID=UPI0036777A43